ncbi:MAG: DUF488 domain-containing protein [Candidatus Brocadiales bacterium]
MGVKTKSVYDDETRGEGLRLLIMRRWPRGITKARIDEWDKDLAPSVELLSDWINKKIPFKEFRKTITLFCHEGEDTHCHRKMLKELIEKRR